MKSCSRCGYSESEKIGATGQHTYATKTTKATIKKDGKDAKSCTKCGEVSSTSTIYKPKTVKLGKTKYVYSGKNCKPSVTLKDSNGNTISKSQYTVSYSNNKNVGTATVKITFNSSSSKYTGTIKKTFQIAPKTTKISKLTATSKGFKVTVKKQITQTSGYEIQYATQKNFKNAKTVRINAKTTAKTISKLKGNTKYYVRVRTYKTVNKKRVYSEWSSVKSVKTKK